jgi:hypothetical protein
MMFTTWVNREQLLITFGPKQDHPVAMRKHPSKPPWIDVQGAIFAKDNPGLDTKKDLGLSLVDLSFTHVTAS